MQEEQGRQTRLLRLVHGLNRLLNGLLADAQRFVEDMFEDVPVDLLHGGQGILREQFVEPSGGVGAVGEDVGLEGVSVGKGQMSGLVVGRGRPHGLKRLDCPAGVGQQPVGGRRAERGVDDPAVGGAEVGGDVASVFHEPAVLIHNLEFTDLLMGRHEEGREVLRHGRV